MKVLVTGAGALLGQGIIKSIKKSSLPVEVIAVDPNELAVGLYWADRYYLIPMADDSTYINILQSIITKEKPDIIFIGTDVELPLFAAYKSQIESEFNCHVVVSPVDVVKNASDKYLTNIFLRENGFLFPKTCLPEEKEQFLKENDYPLIVKPRVGARSLDVYKVNNFDELQHCIGRVNNPIIQEYIGNSEQEYTAGVLVFDGVCNAAIVMRRDLRDGNTYRAYIDRFDTYKKEIVKIAEILNPYGPANFQFRTDKEGIKIFEINARFSGTTIMRAMAGFNEVEMVIKKLIYGQQIVQPLIKPITVLRYWDEIIVP